jgi:16S rRNA G1207 methylase RsmC
MSGIPMGNFMAFPQAFDFCKYKTLADEGGSAGLLSIRVAKHQPHMNCTTWDLPPVEPCAKATIQQFQLTERIKTAKGDFFSDATPKADVIVMGNIVHDLGEDTKIMLIKKAYDALPNGGAFVAI